MTGAPQTPAVTFVYSDWVGMFPEFAAVSSGLATGYFLRAGAMFENTQSNPAYCAGTLTILLYLLTAHLAALYAPRDAAGNPSTTGSSTPAPPGRIASASEGSVSTSFELETTGQPGEAFFTQTAYGLEFWTLTAQYRLGFYAANPTLVASAIYPMRPYGRRGW